MQEQIIKLILAIKTHNIITKNKLGSPFMITSSLKDRYVIQSTVIQIQCRIKCVVQVSC